MDDDFASNSCLSSPSLASTSLRSTPPSLVSTSASSAASFSFPSDNSFFDDENENVSNVERFDDDNSIDDISWASDEFYGRDVIDAPPDDVEEDGAWFQYMCHSDQQELRRGTKRSPADWDDCLISEVGEDCKLVLDASKKHAWETCFLEVEHIRSSLHTLLGNESENEPISIDDIFDLTIGEKSEFYLAFSNALNLDRM